ncbi:hypothetical protein C8Q78DRAFT_1082315 [Trametes maxima]|nr:hypothetical protein C8Q78DRAFT_1082315 [Trametes maxima]
MLVCKIFFFYASAALWRTIAIHQGENPLWVVLGIAGQMRNSAPAGQLGQRDLLILHKALRDPIRRNNLAYYCSLVCSLLFDTGVIAPGIMPILCRLPLDGSPLFCGLQRLYWTESPIGSSDLLCVIYACVEELTVIVGQNHCGATRIEAAYTHWAQQLVTKISLLSPSLRHLSLISNGLGAIIPTGHRRYFCELHSAPVHVYVKDTHGSYRAKHTLTAESTLNALRELNIYADYGSPKILNNAGIVAPHLEATLQAIRISMDHFTVPGNKHPELIKNISGLLTLRRLMRVSITLGNVFPGIRFSDRDFLRLANAWPLIQYLKLSFRQDICTMPPNMASLGSFISMCPSPMHLILPAMQGPQTHGVLSEIKKCPSSKLSLLNIGRVYLNVSDNSPLPVNDIVLAICEAFPGLNYPEVRLEVVYLQSGSHAAVGTAAA